MFTLCGYTEQQQKLFNDNIGYAQALAHKTINVPADDSLSIAMEALLYASEHYDEKRKATFSTFLNIVFKSRISNYIKKREREFPKKYREKTISLDMPCTEDDESTITEIIEDVNEIKTIDKLMYEELLSEIKNKLDARSPKYFEVVKYMMEGETWKEIAKKVDYSSGSGTCGIYLKQIKPILEQILKERKGK